MNQSIPNQQGQTSRGNLCQYCFKWLSKKCLLYYEFQNIEYQVSNGFSLADFGSLCSRKTRWTLISYSLEILGSDWLTLKKILFEINLQVQSELSLIFVSEVRYKIFSFCIEQQQKNFWFSESANDMVPIMCVMSST